jgi:hypothetical protein
MSNPDRPDRHAPQKIDEKDGVFKSLEELREARASIFIRR